MIRRPLMKKKIALIVQRYGLEVNGGAEYHCRQVAEKLCKQHEVEVLTSCAQEYSKWSNYFKKGLEEINGVNVRRFEVPFERNSKATHSLRKRLKRRKFVERCLSYFGLRNFLKQWIHTSTLQDEYEWVKNQGPYLPELVKYLSDHQDNYDVFIFFTYLYYPTIHGLQIDPSKSILIPTAHDEEAIYFSIFQKIFQLPKVILFNTESERSLVHKLFKNQHIHDFVVGMGIDQPSVHHDVDQAVMRKYGLIDDSDYFVYIGRVDEWKGCKELNEYFLAYRKKRNDNNLKLVLIGQKYMKIINDGSIIETGFVDDFVKNTILAGAKALIMPSHYESLSLVTLESMSHGIPVIAHQHSAVLRDHIIESRGGLLYGDYATFEKMLDKILEDDELRREMGNNAIDYVKKYYSWDTVLGKIQEAITLVSG